MRELLAVAKKTMAVSSFEGVAEAIEQAVDLPHVVRNMLLACLPCGLGTPSDERHELQASMVSMVGDVVLGVQAKLREAVDSEATKVGGTDSHNADLQAMLAKADRDLAESAQDAHATTATYSEATAAANLASKQLEERHEAQRVGDAAMVQAQQSKETLEKGIHVHFRAIVEAQDCEQHHQALLPLLKELTLDKSLMSALRGVCTKPASDRGAFDAMVLEQLGKTLGVKVAEFARVVEEAAPASQQQADMVAEAMARLEASTALQSSAAAARDTAKAAEQAAKDTVQSGIDALAAFEPEYAAAKEARDEKSAAEEHFEAYNIGSLELLRDKTAQTTATTGGA
mmetsp:Transcript_16565/g.53277  ORF Transcript_16565/g.53277 Transcript_16565/m.53277 type:complete len:343 (-) Transcript_16565:309-1337(-)